MLFKIINSLIMVITIYSTWIYVEQTFINNKLEISLTESERIYLKDNNSFYQTKFVLENKSDFIINNEQFDIQFDNSENLVNDYWIKHNLHNNVAFSFEQNNLNFNIHNLKQNDEIEIIIISKTMIDIHSLRINEEKFNNKNILNKKINIIIKNNYTNYYIGAIILIIVLLLYILQLKLKLKLKDKNDEWIEKFMQQKSKNEKIENDLEECIKMYNNMEIEKEKIKEEYFQLLKLKMKEK